ncbi:hypothetical protein GCM10022259_02220 [Aquimarina mytili]
MGQEISNTNPESIPNVAPPDDGSGGDGDGGGFTYRWNRDRDGDGFGDPRFPRNAATKPPGYVANQDDCNDNDSSINPNTVWYRDADNDSFGDPSNTLRQCQTPTGYVRNNKDYDDSTSLITDISPKNFYRDADNDGYGDPNVKKYQSFKPNGYVTNNDDYDDTTSLITNIKPRNFYRDVDNDGYGNPNVKKYQSYQPNGYVANNLDCDDTVANINPTTIWYSDSDNDGFGDPNTTKSSCTKPSGYVNNKNDKCPNEYGIYEGCASKPLQPSNENYVLAKVPQTQMSTIPQNSVKNIISDITYFDGLGRPKQQISINASPNKQDIVTHIAYDNYGRQNKTYLPFERQSDALGNFNPVDVLTDINYYYKNKYPEDFPNLNAANINAYKESVFEASPLNRITKTGAPGEAWKVNASNANEHTIKFNRHHNKANEIPLFEVDFVTNDLEKPTLIQNNHYQENQLYVTITKDENWVEGQQYNKDRTTEEYTDKSGTLILKRTYDQNEPHDTYYVHDKFGNLTYVIPPKVTIQDGVSTSELNELCYQYIYDNRNRLIEKKVPGKGWEYIVYNILDLPIMTQDVNQQNNSPKEWSFVKYDALGRVAYTGIKQSNSTREAMQESANNTSVYSQYESRITDPTVLGGTKIYYSNDAIPHLFSEIHVINYYDDYTFDQDTPTPGTVLNQIVNLNVTGLATGSYVRVLDTEDWITSFNYYDEKGRLIYAHTKNDFLNTTDVVETQLDFTGRVITNKTIHRKGSNLPITTLDKFTYDHMGRMLTQVQTINNQPAELIVSNTYDELGILTKKDVGGDTTDLEGLQTIDYTHNIRGWLTQINSPEVLGKDLFAFEVNYNTPLAGITSLYNGNISATFWKTANDNLNRKRRYIFEYDALNRITKALHGTGNYDLNNLKYDKNGNILRLARNGWQNSTNYSAMDNLFYTYDSGNRLIKVVDNGNNQYGFKDGNTTNIDYEYDTNGNMIKDLNNGITHITYNHLNLPKTLAISNSDGAGTISYMYNAAGIKLKKTVTIGSSATNTEYAGNYVYKNGNLEFFNHPEGYIEPNTTGGFDYIYQYKDHLGNIRLSYSDNNNDGIVTQQEIREENNYYPFGLKHKGYNTIITGRDHQYGFGGKEEQNELGLDWYDFGARNHNPALGRWMNLDPLAEQSYNLTPYRFSGNNPILFNDPNGLWEFVFDSETGTLSLNRQEGDTYDSFLEQMGISVGLAKKLFGVSKKDLEAKLNKGGEDSFNVSEFSSKSKIGYMLQGMEEALTTGNIELAQNPSEAPQDAINNCWNCTINLTTDGRVDSKPFFLPKTAEELFTSMAIESNFDNKLGSDYRNVSKPRIGDAIRYSADGGITTTHGSVFLLQNDNGIQIFTKNGFINGQPYQIMTQNKLVQTYASEYGEAKGRQNYTKKVTNADGTTKTVTQSDKSPYYRKN